MVELRIAEPKNEEGGEYPKIYTFLIGHAFGDKEGEDTKYNYVVEPIGRFGTPTEAEAHVDAINMDVKTTGNVLANDKEFPFLIIESVTVIFREDGSKGGKTEGFFIYDHAANKYAGLGDVSRLDCLGEYEERVKGFIEVQKQRREEHNKEYDPYGYNV